MHTIVLSVKLYDARYNRQHGRLWNERSAGTDHPIADCEPETEPLPSARADVQCDAEQHDAEHDVSEVMRKSMMMLLMTAGNVEEGKDTKDDVKDSRHDQSNLALLPHHEPRFARRCGDGQFR